MHFVSLKIQHFEATDKVDLLFSGVLSWFVLASFLNFSCVLGFNVIFHCVGVLNAKFTQHVLWLSCNLPLYLWDFPFAIILMFPFFFCFTIFFMFVKMVSASIVPLWAIVALLKSVTQKLLEPEDSQVFL